MMNLHRKHPFTLIELCICLALIGFLTSFFSYLGYDVVKEFRKRNGRAAFKDAIVDLHHKNTLLENNLMLLINQKGNTIQTILGGNTKGLFVKKKKASYYVGELFEEGKVYAIEITPQSIPNNEELTSWIEKNNCIYKFYVD